MRWCGAPNVTVDVIVEIPTPIWPQQKMTLYSMCIEVPFQTIRDTIVPNRYFFWEGVIEEDILPKL
jgi:hypothetical protein